RINSSRWRCPKCNNKDGQWLSTRRRWECGGCKAQIGLRAETIMKCSPLPLAIWFAAIRIVSAEPSISPANLQRKIGLNRLATARNMLRKIQAALLSPDVDKLLAGLNHLAQLDTAPCVAISLVPTKRTLK